jgi:hypothetical protein
MSEFDLDIYTGDLNGWHIQMAIAVHALSGLVDQVTDTSDEKLSATGYVIHQRLQALVESCPFPPTQPNPHPDISPDKPRGERFTLRTVSDDQGDAA